MIIHTWNGGGPPRPEQFVLPSGCLVPIVFECPNQVERPDDRRLGISLLEDRWHGMQVSAGCPGRRCC